jgi:hypothetical protein
MQTTTPCEIILADGAGHTFFERRPAPGLPLPNRRLIALDAPLLGRWLEKPNRLSSRHRAALAVFRISPP